jgi:hypothetical protein
MLKNSIRLQSETSLHLWKNYTTIGTSTGHWTMLERRSKFWPKGVWVIVNQSIVNCGLVRNVQMVDRRKQAKLQWLQDPNEVNEDYLSDVRRQAIGHFRNKKREYLKDKINELESDSKNKNIGDLYRGINEFKKSYQPGTNLVKDKERQSTCGSPQNFE